MNKKTITISLLSLLVIFIIFASIKLIIDPKFDMSNVITDKTATVTIGDKDLKVIYKDGNDLDGNITYGNIYTKVINIKNYNDEDIAYSIKYFDSVISNDLVTYDAYISYNNIDYSNVLTNQKLLANSSLVHNLVVPKNSSMNVKIVFKSNMENVETTIKGNIEVTTNLSMIELFKVTVNNIQDAIDNRVSDLNGITVKGYYLFDIKELTFNNEANVSGYLLIDSTDISNIKYVYTIYNDKYLIKNTTIRDMEIINVNDDYINSLNKNSVCHQYDTRITCNSFSSIPKNVVDNKKEFYNNVKNIINEYKDKEVYDDNNYIYVINYNNITGYILLNKNDMFLYLRDYTFMISGYNYKKLGDFDISSTAIRTYNESAYNLSASDKNKVCVFSGFNECFDENNNIV